MSDVQIETYEDSETASEPIEATEEAVSIMEELGLVGQKNLVKPDKDNIVRRGPFRAMTKDEEFTYGVLCPAKHSLANYATGPIPLRVLKIAKIAQDSGLFKHIYVLDRETATVTDPVLIAEGPHENPKWTWASRNYILARWGDELEAFAVLYKKAIAMKRAQVDAAVEEIAKKVKAYKDGGTLTDKQLVEAGAAFVPDVDLRGS
jgi:hypothetical protein